SFVFNSLQPLFPKTPGVGLPPAPRASLPPSYAPRSASIPSALVHLSILPVTTGVYYPYLLWFFSRLLGTSLRSPVSNKLSANPGRTLSTRGREGLILAAKGLYKFYGSVPAVQTVPFTLEPGQVLGYLGPNGSGKSTTVKMLCGLLEPTDGEVTYNGQNIHKDLAAYRTRLGYVPEEANLY